MDSFEYFPWVSLAKREYILNSNLPVAENIEITNSHFSSVLQESAISIDNKEIYFVLSMTSFDSCSGSSIGSAFNIKLAGKGCASLNRVCGTNCDVTDNCLFGFVIAGTGSKGTIDVSLVSISQCDKAAQYHVLLLQNGTITVSNTNVSKCTVNRYSFVSTSTSTVSMYRFCNGADGKLTNHRIQHIYYDSFLEYINYVNNSRDNVDSSSRGLLYLTGLSSVTIKECVFRNTNFPILVLTNQAIATMINCNVEGTVEIQSNGAVNFKEKIALDVIKMTLFSSCGIGAQIPYRKMNCVTRKQFYKGIIFFVVSALMKQ